MDVRATLTDEQDGEPLCKPLKRPCRKNQRSIMQKPTLPPEAEGPFAQLWDALMSDDLDVSCRALLWLKENGHPHVMHRILYQTQVALRSRSQKVRDKASALIYFLGPRLVGYPPAPPSLDDLTSRLADPDPQVRQQAAEALGDMGKAAQPAVELLRQLLRDSDAEVQFRAAVAIGQITGNIPEKPHTETTLDLLRIALAE